MNSELGKTIQTADWEEEKHTPVITCPETVTADQTLEVGLELGKAVSHPNTTEHHIRWIQLYYQPDGSNAVYELAKVDFNAHGESTAGANEGPVTTQHAGKVNVALRTSGVLHAMSYCNIHGLWSSKKQISVV